MAITVLEEYIFNMIAQKNEDDSMNFSIINKNESHQGHLDFSVQSLLENNGKKTPKGKQQPPDPQTARQNVFSKVKQIKLNTTKTFNKPVATMGHQCSQQFLKDLSRMEKELSFEAESYNIYEDPPNNSIQIIQNNKSKTLSYLKVTKEFTSKSISKQNLQDFSDYYGDLIIDFHRKDGKHREKIISKNDSKKLSSHQSHKSISKNVKVTSKSRKDINNFYRLKDVKSPSKDKLPLSRQSKSKSQTQKMTLPNSKSQSHLKTYTQGENLEEKVFTQYYGTQVNFNPPKKVIKKKKEAVLGIPISKEKSSKSKLALLSPRAGMIKKVKTKK